MTKATAQILLPFLLASLISCKKESVNPAILSGNWSFTRLSGSTNSVETSQEAGGIAGKVVTDNEYTSTQCSGTVNFDGNTMKYDSVEYMAVGSQKIMSYQNNVPNFPSSYEISQLYPLLSAKTLTSSFVTVGADSIHFLNNSGLPGSGGLNNPPSNGAKFSISGDTLTLTSTFYNVASMSSYNSVLTGTVVITLTRQ